MKLELDGKEVQAVLLEYAQAKFPGMFNTVEGARYETIPGVVFSFEEKQPEPEKE